LQPSADDGSALLVVGRPGLREAVVDNVVALDAERVLNDLGGAVGVVAVNRLFDQIGRCTPYCFLVSKERSYGQHKCSRRSDDANPVTIFARSAARACRSAACVVRSAASLKRSTSVRA
jgi:hypothetical protein